MDIQVRRLLELGPLPPSAAATESVMRYQRQLERISGPLTNEEAEALVKLFGHDDAHGMAWTLIHLVETAPDWPIDRCLEGDNEWIRLLKARAESSGIS